MMKAIETEGTCKCGRHLIIVKTPGVAGFTSKHELPMCAAYRALVAEGIASGKTRTGKTNEYIPPRRSPKRRP